VICQFREDPGVACFHQRRHVDLALQAINESHEESKALTHGHVSD
jgi:hypothetical protein